MSFDVVNQGTFVSSCESIGGIVQSSNTLHTQFFHSVLANDVGLVGAGGLSQEHVGVNFAGFGVGGADFIHEVANDGDLVLSCQFNPCGSGVGQSGSDDCTDADFVNQLTVSGNADFSIVLAVAGVQFDHTAVDAAVLVDPLDSILNTPSLRLAGRGCAAGQVLNAADLDGLVLACGLTLAATCCQRQDHYEGNDHSNEFLHDFSSDLKL